MASETYIKKLNAIRSGHYSTQASAYKSFQRVVLDFFAKHARSFTWRNTRDPYKILVSEIMLQQTQTARVAEKFPIFLKQFPTVQHLARAPQSQVLQAWQGLGYYRRARNLHRAAQAIVNEQGGAIPKAIHELKALPGIGSYTASAVCAFAYNQPVSMIETNIRSVFIYTFFSKRRNVSDKEILPLIAATLPSTKSREWFYALMDLGVELKQRAPGINKASKHHAVQTRFKGSDREIAAKVLRFILNSPRAVTVKTLYKHIPDRTRVDRAIVRLLAESMLVKTKTGAIYYR